MERTTIFNCRKRHYLPIGAIVLLAIAFISEMAFHQLKLRGAIDTVGRLGGTVHRTDACFDDGVPYGAFISNVRPPWITQFARSLGIERASRVVHVGFGGHFISKGDLAVLRDFPDLLNLDLHDTGIDDAGLQYLFPLKKLRNLDLRRTHVTDAGLQNLTHMSDLTHLYLDGTNVTSQGIRRLSNAIPGLETVPAVIEETANWDGLRDEVGEFLKEKQTVDP